MLIVVSGTHASGKSTLISDFAIRHPDFTVLPDPFELIDESWDGPAAGMFAAQLHASANRLHTGAGMVIAERGPLDFLAYLVALDELGAPSSPDLLERSARITAQAMEHVDLLVVLPLDPEDPIGVGPDEHLELRSAMNDSLLDLVEDPDLVGTGTLVVEIVGTPEERLLRLESALALGGS